MEIASRLARYAHALGRWQAAWRFASPELRRVVALAQISAAWDTFRRDAGPAAVGREHSEPTGNAGISCTHDPRRAGVPLWLANHGSPPISDGAGLLARMIGAERSFGPNERDLIQTARDALGRGARPGSIVRLLRHDDAEADEMLASLEIVAADGLSVKLDHGNAALTHMARTHEKVRWHQVVEAKRRSEVLSPGPTLQ